MGKSNLFSRRKVNIGFGSYQTLLLPGNQSPDINLQLLSMLLLLNKPKGIRKLGEVRRKATKFEPESSQIHMY